MSTSYTQEQVAQALNEAADDIIERGVAEEQQDLINLVVNVALCYLDGTAGDLDDAIEHSYGIESSEVLDWVGIV